MVQLTDDLVEQLDREAARRGCSRSALIREAVVAHLAADVGRERVERYVDGYRRIPQGDVDEWGDLAGDRQRESDEVARRLTAEERTAGVPW